MESEEFIPYCLESRDIKVITVIVRDSNDVKDNSSIIKLQEALNEHYDQLYIMEEAMAKKINATASPTRFYFNGSGVIFFLQRGVPGDKESLCEEMDRNWN
jgi:hypothetical protein